MIGHGIESCSRCNQRQQSELPHGRPPLKIVFARCRGEIFFEKNFLDTRGVSSMSTTQSSVGFTRRGRAALSEIKPSSRRSSILKKPEMTPDKENTGNSRGFTSRRKSSLGGDKKRRVSFSTTDQIHTISPAKQAAEKKSALSRKLAEPTPE